MFSDLIISLQKCFCEDKYIYMLLCKGENAAQFHEIQLSPIWGYGCYKQK